MVDASPDSHSALPDPANESFDPEDWAARAAAVRTRQEFGELISGVARAARISVGAVKTQLSGGRTVYDWFKGRSLPRDAGDARRLAECLSASLARRYPRTDLTDPIYYAWIRLAEQRQEDAALRATANRKVVVNDSSPSDTASTSEKPEHESRGNQPRPGLPGSDRPAAQPPVTTAEQRLPPRTWGWLRALGRVRALRRIVTPDPRVVVLAVAFSLIAASIGAFAATRAVIGPRRYSITPCAEALPIYPQGFVRMYVADGPPGDPRPRQHAELRMQT
ncbi:hypothetical protein, partial [Nocardia sp. NPDC004722]